MKSQELGDEKLQHVSHMMDMVFRMLILCTYLLTHLGELDTMHQDEVVNYCNTAIDVAFCKKEKLNNCYSNIVSCTFLLTVI